LAPQEIKKKHGGKKIHKPREAKRRLALLIHNKQEEIIYMFFFPQSKGRPGSR
jgi:hypothetical protein